MNNARRMKLMEGMMGELGKVIAIPLGRGSAWITAFRLTRDGVWYFAWQPRGKYWHKRERFRPWRNWQVIKSKRGKPKSPAPSEPCPYLAAPETAYHNIQYRGVFH